MKGSQLPLGDKVGFSIAILIFIIGWMYDFSHPKSTPHSVEAAVIAVN